MVFCPQATLPLCNAKNQKSLDAIVTKISQKLDIIAKVEAGEKLREVGTFNSMSSQCITMRNVKDAINNVVQE
ncbi:hypothetical protein E2C01_011114 [Portunus trituberculatus]|uniref:Uncharacterized protein n=1 Tax=Portunus trituberculatus TaxID=210409 RepID=A0A5B7DAU6_PORTR|nr:hypothetical protein [Portunus trituberculatus]